MTRKPCSFAAWLAVSALTVSSSVAFGDSPPVAAFKIPVDGKQVAIAAPGSESGGTVSEGTVAPADAPTGTVTPGGDVSRDRPQSATQVIPAKDDDYKSPILKSVILFDQSVTTQTVGVGGAPQSYIPVYEWWVSFRPRYYLTDKIYVWGRFDYFKEFTNSDNGRTNYREDSFGDVWTNAVYETPVPAISKNTKVSAGLRALWPTSKGSQDAGIYVNAGLTGAIKQRIPLRGESASFLPEGRIGLSEWYSHNFSQATTPVNGSLDYARQDIEGHTILSDQLSGTTLVNHQLVSALDTGVDITQKLSLTLDMILIQQWHYAPPTGVTVPVAGGGSANVPPDPTAQNYGLDTWFIANVDYELLDELTLSFGYMNLQNELSYQGQRRSLFGSDNIFWSPDSRFFFDITANLDKVYDRVSGRRAAQENVQDIRSEGR